MAISVVIPLASRRRWPHTLIAALAGDEIVVVCPDPPPVAASLAQGVIYVQSRRSRGGQIACGVAASRHACLWVLHADTTHISAAREHLVQLQGKESWYWGRFDVAIAGVAWVPGLMNLRSRLSKICTGDQGMFFSRTALQLIGGFPQQPLMEDIEVSRRLRRALPKAFTAPHIAICSDGHRWLQQGWLTTIFKMWALRLRYFFGTPAEELYRVYYDSSNNNDNSSNDNNSNRKK